MLWFKISQVVLLLGMVPVSSVFSGEKYFQINESNSSMFHDGFPYFEIADSTSQDNQILGGDLNQLNGLESGAVVVGAKHAHRNQLRGRGELVSVWDTGFGDGRPDGLADFEGRIAAILLSEEQQAISKIHDEADLVGGKIQPLIPRPGADIYGHGTHVAGTIASDGTASHVDQSPRVYGIAPEARLIINPVVSRRIPRSKDDLGGYRVLEIPREEDELYEWFDLDRDLGARVVSNSWGVAARGVYGDADYFYDKWNFENQDVSFIFSAGNQGLDDGRHPVAQDFTVSVRQIMEVEFSTIGSPALAKNVIAVGATHNALSAERAKSLGVKRKSSRFSGDVLERADFSSMGPTRDGRIKPDVSAPGTPILSNYSDPFPSNPDFVRENPWGNFDENYCFMGGTSMSAPLVSGSAALVRQWLKEKHGFESIPSSLVKALLVHSATRFPFSLPREQSPAELSGVKSLYSNGYGVVNLQYFDDRARKYHFFPRQRVSKGKVWEKWVDLEKIESDEKRPVEDLRVTLAWIDPPKNHYTNFVLLSNDLDLVVQASDETHLPISAISIDQFDGLFWTFNSYVRREMTEYSTFLGIFSFPIKKTRIDTVKEYDEFRAQAMASSYPYSIKDFSNNLEQIDIESLDADKIRIEVMGTRMDHKRQDFDLVVSYAR